MLDRRLFLLVGALVLVEVMFYAVLTPLLPYYAEHLHLSKAQAGVLSAFYAFGTIVFSVPAGFLVGRIGARSTVVVGIVLLAASSLAFGFLKSVAGLDAANHIRHEPYRWGGGHRRWRSHGYDCSGSVSYVLHRAGLLDYPLDSTGFMHWGKHGRSDWATIYASHEHVYMVIAGLRWDTSYTTDGDRSGPGWSTELRDNRGYRARHPVGVQGAQPLG